MLESNLLLQIHQILLHCIHLYKCELSTVRKTYKFPKVFMWIHRFPFLYRNNQDCFIFEYVIKVHIFSQIERKAYGSESTSVLVTINFPLSQYRKVPNCRAP